jgi:hypothetical protein
METGHPAGAFPCHTPSPGNSAPTVLTRPMANLGAMMPGGVQLPCCNWLQDMYAYSLFGQDFFIIFFN